MNIEQIDQAQTLLRQLQHADNTLRTLRDCDGLEQGTELSMSGTMNSKLVDTLAAIGVDRGKFEREFVENLMIRAAGRIRQLMAELEDMGVQVEKPDYVG